MSSSPDPLHDTPIYQTTRAIQSSRPRHSFPLQASSPTKQSASPTKQTFELDIGNHRLTQKIRVTVEAGSDVENDDSHHNDVHFEAPSPSKAPVKGIRARTTTTTVAVKGLSDSEDGQPATPKRGRGRPRKSGTPVPAKPSQRASTPVRKNAGRRRSVGTLVDGDDENDEDFSMGKNVEISRRGRPRSKSMKGKSRKSILAANEPGLESAVLSSTAQGDGSGAGNRDVVVEQDADATNAYQVENMDKNRQMAETLGDQDQALSEDGFSSKYSTVRSALASGHDIEDVVVARFEPGNETPRLPGWSSPRFVETHQERDQRSLTLPESSPGRSSTIPTGEETPEDTSQSPAQRRSSEFQRVADNSAHALDVTHEHVIDEIQEFDTILESEGFSMISVDSVPSLREHLSSPANQPTIDEPYSDSVHENSLMPSASLDAQKVPTSSASSKVSKVFASKPECLHLRRHSSRRISMNDSFSSVAPDILNAASPQKITHVSRVSQRLPVEDNSFSSISPDVLAAASPIKLPLETPSSQHRPSNHNHSRYEDSFSGIPSAILDAATPAPVRQMLRKAQALDTIRLSVPLSKSTSTRLLTPEETPSPPADSSAHLTDYKQREHQSSLIEGRTAPSTTVESSPTNSHMKSSPPAPVARRYTYTAHLRQQRQLQSDVNQTPSIIFSSPSLPPPIQLNKGNAKTATHHGSGPRPTLSPIARAGRVLQDVLVPMSSPRSRAQSLGSPFKSPLVGRQHFSFEEREDSAESNEQSRGPIGLGLENVAEMLSPKETGKRLSGQDDPFGANTRVRQSHVSPPEKVYSLGRPQQRQLSGSQFSGSLSFNDSMRSEDAMSWQADQEVEIPALVSSRSDSLNTSEDRGQALREGQGPIKGGAKIWEEQWAAERAAVVNQIAGVDQSKVFVIESDGEDENDCGDTRKDEEEDEEEFGLLLETLNSSSPVSQQAPVLQKEAGEKPRRSKLPSPWRKNSKRLVYNDELYNLTATSEDLFGPKEKSAITQPSADPITVRRAMPAVNNSDDIQTGLSGWHIPQKSNFQPKARNSSLNADLSALFASSPTKPLPVLSRLSKKVTDNGETNASPQNPSAIDIQNKNLAEENIEFAPIPQKADFQPRPRKSSCGSTSSSPFKPSSFGIFGGPSISNFIRKPAAVPPMPNTTSKALALASPSKTNSLPFPSQLISPSQSDQTLDVQQSSPGYDTSCVFIDDKENAEAHQRTLKWTESLQPTSSSTPPTKSCLRSPLKAPFYNTQCLTPTHPTTLPSPSKTVAFVSSSPMPSSPITAPLSTTTWSRAHWVLLDGIVQTWKPENQSPAAQLPRRRNSTRVISKLLGRMVRAEGAEMRLEQWHLDAVDEFRGRVNGGVEEREGGKEEGKGEGWEEKVIALRLFALLEGERRRKEGLID